MTIFQVRELLLIVMTFVFLPTLFIGGIWIVVNYFKVSNKILTLKRQLGIFNEDWL